MARGGARVLLERDSELASLWRIVESAREQRGAVTIVEGEAGIGKTSLLEETVARAASEGITVLRARGTALESGFGFGIVRQLFERTVLDAGVDQRAALMTGAAALAAPAIGAESHVDRQVGENATFAIQHGLYWLACKLCETAPVVLLIDDAQWGDAPSLRWLLYLARRLDGVALALLIAWRTGEPGVPDDLVETLRSEPVTHVLAPASLSENASTSLVRNVMGDDAVERFCQACHQTTGGNPFLLRALLAALQDGVIAPTAEATRRVQQLGPPMVRRSVLLRLSRLGDEAAALARAVAVLNADAEPRFAYALLGVDPVAGARAAAALEMAQILEAGDVFRFTHPIVRAAVYEDLPVSARAAQHRHAAQVLIEQGADPDRAVMHLLATQPAGDPWVVGQLLGAAGRAVERGTPEMASALVERALAEPASPELRAALLLAAGKVARILIQPDARHYLRDALQQASDPALRGDITLELANTIWRSRPEEAVDLLRAALRELPARHHERAEQLHLKLLMIENSAVIRPAGEVEHEIRQLRESAAPGSPARQFSACLLVRHQALWAKQPCATVVGELARDLHDVRPLIDTYGVDFVPLPSAAFMLALFGHPDVGDAVFTATLDAAWRTGSAFAFNNAATWRGMYAVLCGNFADAEADARVAMDAAALTGSWTAQRFALIPLVWALTARGEYAEADAVLAAHGLEREAGSVLGIDTLLLVGRGLLRYRQARYAEAREDIVREFDVMGGSPSPLHWSRCWAPRVLAAAGEHERALELAEETIDAARVGGLNSPLGIALHSAGLAERGQRSIELLREAAGFLSRSSWRWEHAETLVDLGAALRRANRRLDAREPLREGLDLAGRLGALALAERARQELTSTGARPRRLARSGVDALTAREHRVASMAANGASIPEIAQNLFVTRKTVESHLYAAYRKLDVNTRDELALSLSRDTRTRGGPPDLGGAQPGGVAI